FQRLGLDHRIVTAYSGAMGGSRSEEFLAPADVGEDTFVSCSACEYAANVEAVQSLPPDVGPVEHPPLEVLDTPGTPTIDTMVELIGDITAADTLKNLVVLVDERVVAVGVPGDRDVDLARLQAALAPARVRLFEAADFTARP